MLTDGCQACGSTHHSLAMDVEGGVFAWGCNCHTDAKRMLIGRLGLPSKHQILPRQVAAGAMDGAVVQMVAAGANHSVALTAGGKLIFWGWLRRPAAWEDEGYGAIQSSAQLVPAVVAGPWELEGSVAYVAAGANKVVVVVNPQLSSLFPEDAPLASVANDSYGKPVGSRRPSQENETPVEEIQQREIIKLTQHNEKLTGRVEELEATLERARAIFERYLPHALGALNMKQ